MPLKNQSYKSRKHPSFNRASKAQRLRRIEEKRLAYNGSSFKNNTIAPINEPDLFASLLRSGSSAGTPELKPTMQHHVDHEFVTMNCVLPTVTSYIFSNRIP
ncbi:hypothetical protein TNCV_2819511 [Trichonephila clavipes]|nr:hypothetical protein TNCV_2819511 [Trichonephila clavipes]